MESWAQADLFAGRRSCQLLKNGPLYQLLRSFQPDGFIRIIVVDNGDQRCLTGLP